MDDEMTLQTRFVFLRFCKLLSFGIDHHPYAKYLDREYCEFSTKLQISFYVHCSYFDVLATFRQRFYNVRRDVFAIGRKIAQSVR